MTSIATRTLLDQLLGHYRRPKEPRGGVALMTEVPCPDTNRVCDLVAVSLSHSRGYGQVDAHELKVSRSDWLRELHDPDKAEPWWQHSHRFWVVAPTPEVVRTEELPAGWGLMCPSANARHRRFRVLARPADREPRLTHALLAELLRRNDNNRLAEMDAQHAEHVRTLDARAATLAESYAAHGDSALRRRLRALDALEKALGFPLDQYANDRFFTGEDVGTALRDYVVEHVDLRRREEALVGLETRLGGWLRRALEDLARTDDD